MNALHIKDALRVPSLVSGLRVVLALVFPFVVDRPWIAISMVLGAGVSDVLDGWLARRRGEVTALGALLDAVADKFFVASVLLALVLQRRVGLLDVALLSTRELLEAPTLLWGLLRPAPLARERAASPLGKTTTAFQFAALLCALLGVPYVVPMIGAAATGVVAGIGYAIRERADQARPRSAQ